jgi:hypothetical protein
MAASFGATLATRGRRARRGTPSRCASATPGASARSRLRGIVERRCVTMQNGAAWQAAAFHRLYEDRKLDRLEALRRMTVTYREHMHANEPVHEWPLP